MTELKELKATITDFDRGTSSRVAAKPEDYEELTFCTTISVVLLKYKQYFPGGRKYNPKKPVELVVSGTPSLRAVEVMVRRCNCAVCMTRTTIMWGRPGGSVASSFMDSCNNYLGLHWGAALSDFAPRSIYVKIRRL